MNKVYRFVLWAVLVVAALILLLRSVAIRWWQVPLATTDPELVASIAPSLNGGDWVLLWRLTRPDVGDLVLCPDPDDSGNVVIGRIAAQANDKIILQGPAVEINGQVPAIEYNCTNREFTVVDPDTKKETEISCNMEDLGGKLHARGQGAGKGSPRRFEKQIEAGRVFLLSDNRSHPFDSRHFGTLVRQTCSETVFFRLVGPRVFSTTRSV